MNRLQKEDSAKSDEAINVMHFLRLCVHAVNMFNGNNCDCSRQWKQALCSGAFDQLSVIVLVGMDVEEKNTKGFQPQFHVRQFISSMILIRTMGLNA